MATLSFQHIDKVYPNKVQAVFDFNLEVKDKEFIAFVGPSGCGKSTTLRMIAGLEDITAGELYIDDRLINGVMPKNRNIAMVFQNYALYPHMSVYDNMAFALKLRKNSLLTVNKLLVKKIKESLKNNENDPTLLKEVELFSDVNKIKQLLEEENYLDKLNELSSKYGIPLTKESFYKYRHYNKQEIKERVLQAAEILGITPYLERKPAALSGGQRQRVALGRAIVRSPKVFLMDEPLSNLDAKLRVQMRSEIIKIHKRVNATTIYVTHDQTEAMTMADRIVVMKDGYIQQIGTPKEVYSNPSNMFVAGFIGSPSMNFFKVVIKKDKFIFDGENHVEISLKGIDKSLKEKLKEYEDKEVVLGVRPESIDIDAEGENTIPVNYDISELLGYELLVYGYINNQRITFKTDLSNEKYINSNLKVKFDLSKIAFFDKESTNRI